MALPAGSMHLLSDSALPRLSSLSVLSPQLPCLCPPSQGRNSLALSLCSGHPQGLCCTIPMPVPIHMGSGRGCPQMMAGALCLALVTDADVGAGSRVHEIPFQFNLLKLLPRCQQIEMFFLMLTRGKYLPQWGSPMPEAVHSDVLWQLQGGAGTAAALGA